MFADDALISTFSAWLKGSPKKGSIFVDASTVYTGTVKQLAAEAANAGVSLTLLRHMLHRRHVHTVLDSLQQAFQAMCCQLHWLMLRPLFPLPWLLCTLLTSH